jgi:colanic acid biosynthesis glycosyl transferase WcaI
MLSKLFQKGVSREKALLFPNWVDTEAIYPLNCANPFRGKLGIPETKVVALYSGNMGQKQGIEILIDVAGRLENTNIQFILCGEGAVVESIRDLASDLQNVVLLPLQPPEKLNKLLNFADIHLLPQKAEAADLVMPSKLTGIFASGRPVIAMGNPDTEIGKVVSSRGILVPPGDAAAFARAITRLAENPGERQNLGKAAREFAVEELDRKEILSQFTEVLNTL